MTVCELDSCDNEVTRRNARFCSRICAYAGQARPGKANRPQRDRCARDLHPLSGGNLRVDKLGRRSCKACAAIAERKRRPNAAARKRATRKPLPMPAITPATATEPARVMWRPAGFTPVPATSTNSERQDAS